MPWAGPATITEPTSVSSGTGLPGSGRAASYPPHSGRQPSTFRVSATLAANEVMARRRERGEPVLPLAFGESGLPVHPRLIAELASTADPGGYGPVAGTEELRAAARLLVSPRATDQPLAVFAGPGSKALLFAVLLALGTDVAVPRPSWVSYAAQARLLSVTPLFVPVAPGEGGCCDPAALDIAATAPPESGPAHRRRPGDPARQPHGPPGQSGGDPRPVRGSRTTGHDHHQRRDLPGSRPRRCHPVPQPRLDRTGPDRRDDGAEQEPGRWADGGSASPGCRVGRPEPHCASVCSASPARSGRLPARQCSTPPRSRSMSRQSWRTGWRAAGRCTQSSASRRHASARRPDSTSLCRRPRSTSTRTSRRGASTWQPGSAYRPAPTCPRCCSISTAPATLPASAFGEEPSALRLRLATGLLYGDSDEQRETALAARDPLGLPWIRAALDRFAEILDDLQP